MEYQIHGKAVRFSGDCGIYSDGRYERMPTHLLVDTINVLERNYAVKSVSTLRDRALEQISERTPHGEEIGNTRRFCDDVLRTLQGQ